jgi:tetratricopeptide (TPR) repeat protein
MAATIDNLRIDHRVTVICDFTDSAGVAMRVGDSGIIREISFDQIKLQAHLGIEREGGKKVALMFQYKARQPARSMKEIFELGDYVPVPGTERVWRDPSASKERKMIVPPQAAATGPKRAQGPDWAHQAKKLEDDGEIEAAVEMIRKNVDHIGRAASIAELYARQMRAFQRVGDEPRAVEAFTKAVDWINSYAGSATSGGEGAALSREADDFREALAREFGYDPTEPPSKPIIAS